MPNGPDQKPINGPWWSRLGTAAIAVVGIVYIVESLGGRLLDIVAADLAAEREMQRQLVESLRRTAAAHEAANKVGRERLEVDKDQNRLLEKILEELRERRRQKSTE